MKLVGKWAQDDPRTPLLSPFYCDLVEEGNTFANGLPNFMIRADLPGALRKVEASIRDMYQSTVEERTANALSWRFGIRKVVGSRARMMMCPNATIF
ncbi:hypothetical protein PI124_g2715 [Phytophthora idaei]|nr:hypothetical protein PI126_g21430 [Phytophthora idaei]KAG3252680.1 hypothetical protein PI124_g2715 [Phytophthora idaei]